MKKHILIVGFLFIGTITLSAQEKFIQGETEMNGEIFRIRFSNMFPSIHVRNISRNIDPVPRPRPGFIPFEISEGNMSVDTARERNIIYDVLVDKRKQLKANKDRISISYVFYQNGTVMNISYILPDTTLIAPIELAEIDRRLRKEVKALFKGVEYLDLPAIEYNSRRSIYF